MLDSQKCQLRGSEIRQRLAAISAMADDAITDEVTAETAKLTAELRTNETKFQAALAAETAEAKQADNELRAGSNEVGDSADRELRTLQGRVLFSKYVGAYLEQRAVDGAEKELAEHRSVPLAGGFVPWDALLPVNSGTETRADVATPGLPAASQPNVQHRILPQVFARSRTAMLGVAMPQVDTGTQVWPTVTTAQDPEFVAQGATKEAAAGALTSVKLSPKRLQARFLVRMETLYETEGIEEALRTNLVGALGNKLDAQILGAGDSEVRGMLATAAQGGIGTGNADPTAVVSFETAVSELLTAVDGIYAGDEGEIGVVVGVPTYRKTGSLFVTNAATSVNDKMRQSLRFYTASANIPAANASNVQQAIVAKFGAPEMGTAAIAPTWRGLQLLRDDASAAATGEISVTGVMMTAFRVVRAAAFHRAKFKLAT